MLFKAGSDHTIDSQRFDGELQIYFEPTEAKGQAKRLALSVLLSSDDIDKKKNTMASELQTINDFFSSLQFDKDLKDGAVLPIDELKIG